MSADLRDLYRQVIVDHSKRPRNFRVLEERARKAEGYNPLCGDQVTVYVDLAADVLNDVAFQGAGCAVCMASASLMTEMLKGKSRAEAMVLFDTFRALVTNDEQGPMDLDELSAFAGVHQFPSRIKCALLAWQVLVAVLKGEAGPVSTE